MTTVSTQELRDAVDALRNAPPDGADIYARCSYEAAQANAFHVGFQWLIERTPDSPDWKEGMKISDELLALTRAD